MEDVNTLKLEIQLEIQKLLGKEIAQFVLKGNGACNNAYYIETTDGSAYIVKQERENKDFQPQNDLVVEASVAKLLYDAHLSVPVPHVVFVSQHPKMYGYEYVTGDTMRDAWKSFSEEERVRICRELGQFHAEIGKEISKVVAQKIGIKIDESLDIHPESVKDCQAVLASVDVPEEFKALAREARILLEETFDKGVFQFIHNDAHRENIIIKDKKISGIIDFGNSEYGEVAKEFSRYIRDFPNHFTHIVSSYEACSGNKLSYQRLVSYALLSGLIDIAEDYRKGGDDRVKAEEAIEIYKKLLQV